MTVQSQRTNPVDIFSTMSDGASNKRTSSERSPRESTNNKIKKTSISNIISEAASKIIETAAPRPAVSNQKLDNLVVENENTWAGDDSSVDLSPAYRDQLKREKENRIGKESLKQDKSNSPVIPQATDNLEECSISLDSKLTLDTKFNEEEKESQEIQVESKTTNHQLTSDVSIDSMLTMEAMKEGIDLKTVSQQNASAKNKEVDEVTTPKADEQLEDQEFPLADLEEEDTDNTVNSGKTTTIGKRNLDKVILPRMIRYQLMLTPFKKASQDDYDEEENFASKVRDMLILLGNELKQANKDAKIVSWRNKKTFTYLNFEEFPEETPEIAKYFQGMRAKVKGDRRVYIKFALHIPNGPFSCIEKEMHNWAKLYNYSVTRCIIQSDNAEFIGWICSSSYYTEVDLIRRVLEKSSDFEWGFKMIAVTDNDKHLQWSKRLKALGAYVPSDSANVAINIITKVMEAEESTSFYLEYIEKFLFVPPKSSLDDLDSQIAYKSFVTRHKMHHNNLVGYFYELISIDIDQYIPIRNNKKATLRHLILEIEVQDPNNPLFGTPLFHIIDFTEDSEKQWFGKGMGPGGEGHIFTYYKQNEAEAKKMIRGLGIYLAKYYGSAGIRKCFDRKHWDGNTSWKYSSSKKRFITPQDNHMKNNLVHDHNRAAMDVMLEMELLTLEQQQREREHHQLQAMNIILPEEEGNANIGQSTQESDANLYREAQALIEVDENSGDQSTNTDITRAIQQEEANLIKKIVTQDTDSLDGINGNSRVIHDIECKEDSSCASSLTNFSVHSTNLNSSIGTLDSNLTKPPTTSKQKKKKVINIESKFESGELEKLSDDEVRERMKIWFDHQKGRKKST